MSLFGEASSFLQGGRDKQGEEALNRALQAYSAIKAPTQQELSLPELQMYVQAGLMTPGQAQAYLQDRNAYADQVIPQTGTQAMVEALNQLSSTAEAGPRGTPLMQAQSADTIQQLNNAVRGNRGAIEQQMQAKGTPAAMIQAALQNQYAGQDAQQAYHNSLDQQAAAYQAAVAALSQKGQLGGQLQGQQNQQANTVSQAQNAMQQFNAANQQQASALNAQLQQQANAANTQNAQNVSNQNVGTKNARTAYNTSQRQQVFDNEMRKAAGMSGVLGQQANNYNQMGADAKDTALRGIGAVSNFFGGPAGVSTGGGGAPMGMVAEGGILMDHDGCYHDGGICMDDGGMVPGEPNVPGNSLQNDTVHVMASPGEAVIPRTAVQQNMPEVLSLIAEGQGQKPPEQTNPSDVATVLKALRELRMGASL